MSDRANAKTLAEIFSERSTMTSAGITHGLRAHYVREFRASGWTTYGGWVRGPQGERERSWLAAIHRLAWQFRAWGESPRRERHLAWLRT